MKISMATSLAAMATFQLAAAAPTAADSRVHGECIAEQTTRWFHTATGVEYKPPVQVHKVGDDTGPSAQSPDRDMVDNDQDTKHNSMLKRDVQPSKAPAKDTSTHKPVGGEEQDEEEEKYDALELKNKGERKPMRPKPHKNARGVAEGDDRKLRGGASFGVDGVSGGFGGVSGGFGTGRGKREAAGRKKKPWKKPKGKAKPEPEPEPEPKHTHGYKPKKEPEHKEPWLWPMKKPLPWWDKNKDRIQPPTRINEEDQLEGTKEEEPKEEAKGNGGEAGDAYEGLKKSTESAAESVAEEIAEETVEREEREKEQGKSE